MGFKENIIVSEYTGCTDYRFILETNGLKPENINGSWFLTDAEGNACAAVGDIIVFTADESNNTLGELTFEEITANERYEAVITLDPEYLSDSKTKYPICIDPTIEVVYNSSADAGKLADVTINSKAQSVGSKDALYIGRSNSAGIERVLMKFPGLNLQKIASGGSVIKAEVELRDLMCQYWTMNVNCHVFTGNVWNESSASWSNVDANNYVSKPLSTRNVNYPDGTKLSKPHRYGFDITEAVIGWREGYYNINKGLLFKADNSFENTSGEAYKTFGSYNRASYKPSLCITYTESGIERPTGTYYLVSRGAEKYLGLSSGAAKPLQGTVGNLGNSVIWKITNCKSYYLIQPLGDQSRYLVQTSGGYPQLAVVSKESIGTYTPAHWAINTNGNNRQATIKNLSTNRFLYMFDGGSLTSTPSVGTYGSDSYINASWYVLPTGYYGKGTSYSLQEVVLGSSSFGNMEVSRSKSFSAKANVGSTCLLSEPGDFTYTSSNSNVTVNGSTLTAKAFGTATITATHRLTGAKKSFSVKVLKKAIIIVPGIFGSNLKKNGKEVYSTSKIVELYEINNVGKAVLSVGKVDALLSLLKEAREDKDVLPINGDYGTYDYYKHIILEMRSQFGQEYDVVFFAYDWRKSCINSAKELASLSSDYDKTIMISHSMGGLVTSYMLAKYSTEASKIEEAFFVGTPFLGAAITAFLFAGGTIGEYLTDLPGVLVAFLDLIKLNVAYNLQSVLELLPTQQSESIKSSQFVGYATFVDMIARLSVPGTEWEAMEKCGYLWQAQDFHDALWINGEHITKNVDSYYIYGDGVDTIVGSKKNGLSVQAIKSKNGDGIVPSWSASLNWLYPNKVKKFEQGVCAGKCSHVELIMNNEVIEYIRGIISH